MGAAEVISFEEVRARKQWDTLRQQLHERFDQGLDTLEQQWHEPPSTLMEVTATVRDLRQQLTGGLTETIVKYAHEGERQRKQASGPRCPRVLKAQDHVWRTVETMGGPVELERPSFSCRACRAGLSPLDDALGLVAGCKQLDRHKAAGNLVAEVPYDTAQSLFHDLTGVPLGSERLHPVANQVAEGLTVLEVAPSREERHRFCRKFSFESIEGMISRGDPGCQERENGDGGKLQGGSFPTGYHSYGRLLVCGLPTKHASY